MDAWDILGIPPNSDSRTVRRAYAQRAKDCHPEEDPEGFQRLYQAYQQALRAARWRERQAAAPSEDDVPGPPPVSPVSPAPTSPAPPALEILPFLDQALEKQREEVRGIDQLQLEALQALPNDSKVWADHLAGEDFQLVMWDLDFMDGLAALLEEEALPEAGCEELYYVYDLYQLENDIRWERDFRRELYCHLAPVYRRRVELRQLQASALERGKTRAQRLWEKLGSAAIGVLFILLFLAFSWLVGEIIY